MKIYVHRPEGNLGPYSEFDLRSMVQSGLIQPSELGWQEGMADWKPLSTFVSFATLPGSPAAKSGASAGKKVKSSVKNFFSGPPSRNNDEGMRQYYRNAETNVRLVGGLYYLSGAIFVIGGALTLQQSQKEIHPTDVEKITPFVCFAIAVLYFWMGRQLRTLNSAGVIPATIVACLGMLKFPVGTVVNGVVLYVLHCSKGHEVFSEEYHGIVERTPKMNRRTGLLTWIALGLIVMVVLYLVYAGMKGQAP